MHERRSPARIISPAHEPSSAFPPVVGAARARAPPPLTAPSFTQDCPVRGRDGIGWRAAADDAGAAKEGEGRFYAARW